MAYQGISINTANTIFQDRRVVFQKNELEGGFQAEHQALGTLRRSSLTTLVKAVVDEWFSLKEAIATHENR